MFPSKQNCGFALLNLFHECHLGVEIGSLDLGKAAKNVIIATFEEYKRLNAWLLKRSDYQKVKMKKTPSFP